MSIFWQKKTQFSAPASKFSNLRSVCRKKRETGFEAGFAVLNFL